MNWKDAKASLLDPNCEFNTFNYDLSDTHLYNVINSLSISGLIEALKEVKGCGCRVDSPGINVRSEIFERVYAALDAYKDHSNNP